MSGLLTEEWMPITCEFGLVQADLESLGRWWRLWDEQIQAKRANTVIVKQVSGDLQALLGRLLPLTSVERRRVLLIPTASKWTAVFDNGWQGTDAAGLSFVASSMRRRAIRVVNAPEPPHPYGARIFELYGAENTEFLNHVRSISVANDGGTWRFDQGGNPLPEEDQGWYSPRTIKMRFREEHLRELLARLGQDVFSERFYDAEGLLLERHGPTAPGLVEYQLADVRASWNS